MESLAACLIRAVAIWSAVPTEWDSLQLEGIMILCSKAALDLPLQQSWGREVEDEKGQEGRVEVGN